MTKLRNSPLSGAYGSEALYRPAAELSSQRPIRTLFWAPYFAVYFFCALFFQLRSGLVPWDELSPVEDFTRPLLWLSSLVCLLIADCYRLRHWRSWLWLAACVALAFLALDESFQFHERLDSRGSDDDHMKAAQWVIGLIGVCIIHLIAVPSAPARKAILFGFFFHTCYILVDVGDGDYFRMPFGTITQLRWAEEFLELSALICYSLGLIALLLATKEDSFRHRMQPPGRAEPS
jgi:hypothetical protein